ESNAAFCLRLGKNCGDTTANDNCSNMMTVNCGMCGQLQACGGGGQSNVCGALTSPLGGAVTSSSPGVAPEDMTKAFDGNTATKWYAGNGVKTGWIAYQFMPAASHTVTSYSISSANDVPVRDPNAWQLQGSNDGQTWTMVDTRTGEMFAARFQTNKYTCTTPGAYSHYRLNVTANNGGNDLQLSELRLFGQ
ncbi:MAG TPA: discoidin domain-containing protein, partial [Polyangiaceae bacterium]|nr:discoidin domain-containing protein [Polyangiaceae bacterium]